MAKDRIHDAVKNALEKAGWSITNDPYSLDTGGVSLEIDLSAERLFFAERGIEKAIFEVKSFEQRSLLYQFHTAVGQYLNYRGAMKDIKLDRPIYLGIGLDTYQRMLEFPFYTNRIEEFGIKLLIVNLLTETIERWIK